jgi:hypothetical protein
MYNALNEQLVIQQARELARELQTVRNTAGGRRRWRRRGGSAARRTR